MIPSATGEVLLRPLVIAQLRRLGGVQAHGFKKIHHRPGKRPQRRRKIPAPLTFAGNPGLRVGCVIGAGSFHIYGKAIMSKHKFLHGILLFVILGKIIQIVIYFDNSFIG